MRDGEEFEMADLRSVLTQFRERRDGQRAWLAKTAPRISEEQRHTVEGTTERAYWHYGYMVALHDVITKLEDIELERDGT